MNEQFFHLESEAPALIFWGEVWTRGKQYFLSPTAREETSVVITWGGQLGSRMALTATLSHKGCVATEHKGQGRRH